MIKSWRDEWGQGDFPFYWVQLADFLARAPEPRESDWAELREAQTMTMSRLPNTGQAVIIDIGEGKDIHPRNKQDVAQRLARWALARDYGMPIAHQSPTYKSMETAGQQDRPHVRPRRQRTPGVRREGSARVRHRRQRPQVRAGQGQASPSPSNIEVWSDQVPEPVAVRYAWADNPVCNVYSAEGLPATPFRTDDWPGVTIHNVK